MTRHLAGYLVCALGIVAATSPAKVFSASPDVPPTGKSFRVRQRSAAAVPGSGGRAEVFLDDITGNQVRLGIRTAEGEILAAPRSLREDDAVPFRLGDRRYAIRVLRLRNLLIGDDLAELRVEERDPPAGIRRGEGPPGDGGPRERAWVKLVELMDRKLAGIEEDIRRAEDLLRAGERIGADTALGAARRGMEEARPGLRFIGDVAPRWDEVSSYFSVIRIRIVEECRGLERATRRGAPGARAYARFLDRLFYGSLPQVIEAEITEVHAVGKRFFDRTLMGRLHPDQRRGDLHVGDAIRLEGIPRATGIRRFEEGREYWVAIVPPLSRHLFPMLVGSVGPTAIVYAARCP